MTTTNNQWVGRFAPSPSGPLHFGSLVAALGSFVIAKQRQGKWLLRIEDIDPPREVAGATDSILFTLEAFGFEWDDEVIYQSQRKALYQTFLTQLNKKKVSYFCHCSRRDLRERNRGIYDNHCRNKLNNGLAQEHAVRVKFNSRYSQFHDEIFGDMLFNSKDNLQDFIVLRRDGLFSYQLAVVVDDIEQKVNHIVRGADILDSTPRQNFLYACLDYPEPKYFHLPLAVDQTGAKLSKRSYSPPVDPKDGSEWLVKGLIHLGQEVDLDLNEYSPKEILQWAIDNWQTCQVGTEPKTY